MARRHDRASPVHSRRTRRSTSLGFLAGLGVGSGRDLACVGLAWLMLAMVAVLGGASRPDVRGLLLLRPAVVLLATALLVIARRVDWRVVRTPLVLLVILALAMLVQLVPLPPAIWTGLPGHAPFAEAADAAGLAQPWRPISLSPPSTWNSLASLLVPGSMLVSVAALPERHRGTMLIGLVAVTIASAALGLVQLATGGFYPYAITNAGRAVGLFANVNHQAALFAATLPLVGAWILAGNRRLLLTRASVGLALIAFLLAAILVDGSRAGLVLAVVGLLLTPLMMSDLLPLRRKGRTGVVLACALAPLLVIAVAASTGNALALERLVSFSWQGADQRVSFLPITTTLAREHWMLGSGFGTFADLFRFAEPDRALSYTYFNHAHNDLIELVITGGVPAMLTCLVFLLALARRGVALFGPAERTRRDAAFRRGALVAMLLLLLASLTDYPLRTPMLASYLAIACIWVTERPRRDRLRDAGAAANRVDEQDLASVKGVSV